MHFNMTWVCSLLLSQRLHVSSKWQPRQSVSFNLLYATDAGFVAVRFSRAALIADRCRYCKATGQSKSMASPGGGHRGVRRPPRGDEVATPLLPASQVCCGRCQNRCYSKLRIMDAAAAAAVGVHEPVAEPVVVADAVAAAAEEPVGAVIVDARTIILTEDEDEEDQAAAPRIPRMPATW